MYKNATVGKIIKDIIKLYNNSCKLSNSKYIKESTECNKSMKFKQYDISVDQIYLYFCR